jgi:hypothetical protein
VLLLVSLTGERAIYLALELDRSWTEMSDSKRPTNSFLGTEAQDGQAVIRGHRCPSDRKQITYGIVVVRCNIGWN